MFLYKNHIIIADAVKKIENNDLKNLSLIRCIL